MHHRRIDTLRRPGSRAWALLGLLLATSAAATTGETGEDPDTAAAPIGSEKAPLLLDLPDSLRVDVMAVGADSIASSLADTLATGDGDSSRTVYTSSADAPLPFATFEVRARRIVRELGADRIELGAGLVETQDGGSVADLGSLLPSTFLTVNSRGEALFQVRGSSERHLAIELDGIPLTLPWDERADLSLLPLVGVGRVVAQRGANSVLDPPNALAGVVEMHTRTQDLPGTTTRVGSWIGESDAWGAQLLHLRRDGAWRTTLALDHRRRGGLLLPADLDVDYFADARSVENQSPGRRVRDNTDLEQTSLLLRVGRDWGGSGNLRLLVQASDGEKGVAPEMHLEPDDARFWRIPTTRRLLVGLGAEREVGAWRVDAISSLDLHRQDVDQYAGLDFSEVTGFENGDDRTWLGRTTLARALGERSELKLRATVRHAVRDQSEDGLDQDLRFAQTLGGVATELVHHLDARTSLRAGVGYEGARTPDTGDKPARAADHEVTAHAAVERDLAGGRAHATVSRRPRFPSMRELFSEALDRFLVNPDLGPEVQTAGELGYSRSSRRTEWSVNTFGQWVDGAIERRNVEVDGRTLRQRVNLDAIRNLGIEVAFVWRPWRGITLDAQHTQLWSRSEVDGAYDGRVEDRPEWLNTVAASWTHASGVRVRSEWIGVGERYSLGRDGLEPLDADLRWNLRLSYRHFGRGGWYRDGEIFVRVDNLLDATTQSQIGLLESGRTLRLGWRVDVQS